MNQPLLLHQNSLVQSTKWFRISMFLILVVTVQALTNAYLTTKESAGAKEVVRYVEFSNRGDFGFKVLTDANLDLSQRQLMIENQLTQYITNRVTNTASKDLGDSEIDSLKVNYVSALSSPDVGNQYSTEIIRIYNEAGFSKRDIHILSFSRQEDRKYRFDFETTDTYPTGEVDVKRWVVYIKYDIMDPNEFQIQKHKELNPLGLKITYYRGDVDSKTTVNVEEVSDE